MSDPTCVNSGSLHVYNVPCTTTYQPFASQPAGNVGTLTCPVTLMGPNYDDDPNCHRRLSGGPYRVACPTEWTSAGDSAYTAASGITWLYQYCCPTVYPFQLHTDPMRTTTTIDDVAYDIALVTNIYQWCGASSIEALSDQVITVTTESASPPIETAWDFDRGTLAAPAATVTQFIYEYNDITSTCIGNELNCEIMSNPLQPGPATSPTPSPTLHPSGTYIPPPSHATTHFDPGPSCIADKSKWLVSTACNLGENMPGWVECAITMTGNPRTKRWGACNPYYSVIDESSSTTWLDQCPVGYTIADSSTFRPFDSIQWSHDGTRSYQTTVSYDVVNSYARCCPGGDVTFSYWSGDGGFYESTTVHPQSGTAIASLWVPPRCIAARVTALADQDIPLTMINNDIIQEKRKRQDESDNRPILGTTTRKWDVDQAIMFAEPAEYGYTVFHETYTCFESCYQYFSFSYGNTDPNYTPTSNSPLASKSSTGVPGSSSSGINTESSEGLPSNSGTLSRNGISKGLIFSSIIAALTLFLAFDQ